MPSLLQIASAKPDIQVTQLLEGDSGEDETEDGYFSSVIDNKRVTMRTSLLDEKSSACITLGSFARELREHFAPYIQSVRIVKLFFGELPIRFFVDQWKCTILFLCDICLSLKIVHLFSYWRRR